MLKKLILVLFLICTILPIGNVFAEAPNAGFVPDSIWYSVDPFKEGDKVKIYAVIFNYDKRELSGTVSFFDKNILLGKKDLTVLGGRVTDVSIDWTATLGSHSIYAKIENPKFLISKGKYENADISIAETNESERTVKKVITGEDDTKAADYGAEATVLVKDLGNTIEEKTPSFISGPLLKAIDFTEGVRTSVDEKVSTKRDEVKKEIEVIKKTETNEATKNDNIFLKPWKYVELFFLTLFYFVFDHKIVFYLILVFLLYLIIRSIWNRFF